MDADSFLGLSKVAGQNLAELNNIVFRLIKKDGEDFLSYPEDVRTDRICVEISDNKITKAIIQ